MRLYLKELLIILYLALGYEIYIARLGDIGLSFAGIAYIALFGLLLITLYFSANIANGLIRLVYGLIFFVSAVLFDAYEKITSKFLTYNSFISLFNFPPSYPPPDHLKTGRPSGR